ncbi:MAG: phytoene/squalene synthase family protein [Chitinophagia bacterium]|nr:phytoene/squalene synthase family protein [Chitinophagia bacterium]
MKQLFDNVCVKCSKITTTSYSTSFSIGIYCVNKELRNAIYAIYGFVRFADEIVDTFHNYNKRELLNEFKNDTWKGIERGISLNPIINSFQNYVKQYGIEAELITCFLDSMEADLTQQQYTLDTYKTYILGSAEVVGLMCLRVFTNNDDALYNFLKPTAMKLGAAFQKVNFLRDIKNDFEELGRVYFPNVNFNNFAEIEKDEIERDIEQDFREALSGIKKLPDSSRFGVYVAYIYYYALFKKIKRIPAKRVMQERIRIPGLQKISLLIVSYCKHRLGIY